MRSATLSPFVRSALAALSALALLPALARAQAPIEEGIVLVLCAKRGSVVGTGTGFAINDRGGVVTNEHVINPEGKGRCDEVKIAWLTDGRVNKSDARIAAADDRLDIALLEADSVPRPLTLRGNDVPRDLDLRVVGYPGAASIAGGTIEDQLNPTLTRGVVSRVFTDDKGRQLVQTDAAISSGNSGGPLMDACRRVIGVATFVPSAQLKAATGAEGIGWAVHVSEVIEFLKKRNVPFTTATEPCTAPPPGAAPPSATPGSDAAGPTEPPSDSQRTLIWLAGGGLVVLGIGLFLLLRRRSQLPAALAPAGPAPSGRQELTIHLAGRAWPIGDHTTIGRDPDICNLVLPPHTEGVSRRHVEVRVVGNGIEVRDCWSSGGTLLGGQPLKPGQWTPWHRGQPLRLGPGTEASLG